MATSLVGKKIGNYEIKRQLGEGGMGAVYLGEHPMIGKKVAVKVLHDELAEKEDIVSRFFNEAKAVNDIRHDNIVDIVDFGKMKDDAGRDVVYFLMEFLEGEALTDRIKKGTISQQIAVGIIAQCASALQASHAKGIVHRDLKPDNIYLIRRGHDENFVKLLDFGIAKLTDTAGANSNKTRAGSVLGTPAYMSPEQCDGKGNIDNRSDVYSLGVVLYELLTGRVPFTGEGFGEILVKQITAQPDPPTMHNPNISPGLEAIVLRCLEKDREHRFQNMDELRLALENSGSYVPPRPATSMNPILKVGSGSFDAPTIVGGEQRPTTLSGSAGEVPNAPPSGGSKLPLFAVVAVVLAGASAGAVFLLNKKQPPAPAAVVQPLLPAEPAKPEFVQVLIDSTPAGATVKRAGVADPVGKTPVTLKLKRGEPSFDVLVTMDGFKPVTRSVSTEKDRDFLVSLDKMEAPTPQVAPTPPTPPKHTGHRTSPTPEGLGARPSPDKPRHVDPDGVLAPSL